MTLKTIVGYEIVPGVSTEEYERWLFEVHAPDLLANPHLDRIVFNRVLRPVRRASGGTATVPRRREPVPRRRDALRRRGRLRALPGVVRAAPHPGRARTGGRTDFRFYVVTESVEVTR